MRLKGGASTDEVEVLPDDVLSPARHQLETLRGQGTSAEALLDLHRIVDRAVSAIDDRVISEELTGVEPVAVLHERLLAAAGQMDRAVARARRDVSDSSAASEAVIAAAGTAVERGEAVLAAVETLALDPLRDAAGHTLASVWLWDQALEQALRSAAVDERADGPVVDTALQAAAAAQVLVTGLPRLARVRAPSDTNARQQLGDHLRRARYFARLSERGMAWLNRDGTGAADRVARSAGVVMAAGAAAEQVLRAVEWLPTAPGDATTATTGSAAARQRISALEDWWSGFSRTGVAAGAVHPAVAVDDLRVRLAQAGTFGRDARGPGVAAIPVTEGGPLGPAAADRLVHRLEELRGQQLRWAGSGQDSFTTFETWASGWSPSPPVHVDTDTELSCWELVLLAAHRAGLVSWKWLHGLYTASRSATEGSWPSYMVNALVPAEGRRQWSDGRPGRGDIVVLRGRDLHVAVATGRSDRTGASTVFSFWAAPDVGSGAQHGTVETVQVTTVDSLVRAMEAGGLGPVSVEFGPGPWSAAVP